jgi:hypothetical protein
MTDYDHIRAVKERAQGKLLKTPGVHAVGIGRKIVGGKRTDDISIAVFVEKKKPSAELPPEHLIPSDIEGIKTDVIEMTRPRRLAGLPDTTTYPSLRGGIRIQPGGALGGGGTLGCIAQTNDTPPKIVALTCEHVVAEPVLLATNVSSQTTGTTVGGNTGLVTITVAGATASAGTLLTAEFTTEPLNVAQDATYITTGTENLETITEKMRDAINNAAIPGVSVTADTTQGTLQITISNGRFDNFRCDGGHKMDTTKLHTIIANAGTNVQVITLSGPVYAGYGVYVKVEPGGTQPTFGGFTPTAKGMTLGTLASNIAAFLKGIVDQIGITGISATATGGKVTVTGAEAVLCDVTTDTRVGQADNRFGCSTSWCTNHRIGRVLGSRTDVDVAMIQLDGGIKYLAQIEQIGVVAGVYEVTDTDVHDQVEYPVRKRGITTGLTPDPDDDGPGPAILHLNVSGFMAESPDQPFDRLYTNAMVIASGSAVFADSGDSGSAVVSTTSNNVVGILFASGFSMTGNNLCLMTPIAQVTKALNITVATATEAQVDVPLTVPAAVGAAMAMLPDDEMEGTSVVGRSSARLRDRLAEVGQEVSAIPLGRDYAEAVQRHIPEVQDLVNQHRRVGAVWNRNGGNQIVASFIEIVQSPERNLPEAIRGRPIAECLRRIQKVLQRYGTTGLANDLARLGPLLMQTVNLTYPQMLAVLRSADSE